MHHGEATEPLDLAHADVLEAVAAFARSVGAGSIANDVVDMAQRLDAARERERTEVARRFCARLEQHLLEDRRALTRTPHDAQRHESVLASCTLIVECILTSLRDQPPVTTEGLRAELEAERRKLLMGRKADLLAVLASCVAKLDVSKRDVERAAARVADEIGNKTIHAWRGELQARMEKRIAAHAAELLERASASCGEPGNALVTYASLAISAVPAVEFFVGPAPAPAAPTWRARLRDVFASEQHLRARAEANAGEQLVVLLERESIRIVDWCARYYAESCAQLEATFADGAYEYALSALAARERAAEASRSGALRQAHERIDTQMRALERLQRRVG